MAEGFGVSVWCTDSRFTARLVSGRTAVAQSIYRRLTTPRGTLRGSEEAAAYGLDLSELVGAIGYPAAIGALPGRIEAELAKDDRIADSSATVDAFTDSSGAIFLIVTIDVLLHDEADSFPLTLKVTDVTTELLGGVPQAA